MSLPAPPDPAPDDESPMLPGFRTWRGVYLAVFIWFVIVVVLLALFTHAYA